MNAVLPRTSSPPQHRVDHAGTALARTYGGSSSIGISRRPNYIDFVYNAPAATKDRHRRMPSTRPLSDVSFDGGAHQHVDNCIDGILLVSHTAMRSLNNPENAAEGATANQLREV